MCINVACCADVAVTQPLLNLLQAHAIGIEQTGAAMAQIVKADTLHLVCDQKIREMLAQEIGPNPFSHRVYIDIVKVIGAIAFAADLCVLAKKCGISYSTIQTTARRGGQLSVETIERICLGLGITLKDFFDSSYFVVKSRSPCWKPAR